ncbi:MAG: flavin reductase family protein [Planctomycetota bacterium]
MLKRLNVRGAMRMLATAPVMIITTRHASGIVNAGVFGAYAGISGDQVGAAIGAESHTYANIKREGRFVINIPGRDIVAAVRIIAGNVPPSRSELDAAGLTASTGQTFPVPHINECVACLECEFEQELDIGYHRFVIGKVTGGAGDDRYMDQDGRLDVIKAGVFHTHRYPEDRYVVFGEEITG